MSRIAYVNGEYRPQREAAVNIEDRGYQFADGIYEVVQLHRGRLIDADLHFARLERSLREISIAMPMTRAALLTVLQEVARRNRISDGMFYMQITRGVSRRDHPFPTKPILPAIVVTIRRSAVYPKSAAAWTGVAITQPDQRWARCDIKSVGLLPNVLARQAARSQGAYEAILVRDGMVTEGAATSVWIVDDKGVLRTRHLDHAILPGCTRASLAVLLRDAGIAYDERGFSEAELRAARELFVTSASSYVKPMVSLDGEPVGDGKVGPVTEKLFALFARHVQGNA